jgi:hypothetical protein
MKSVKYKDYDIAVKSRKMPSGFWRSSAQTKYSSGLISITALPPGLKGYESELKAEKESIAAIKDWIDQKMKI